MSKTVSISKEDVQQWVDNLVDYFSKLPQDEDYAWIAIAAGFVFFIVGVILA